MAPTCIVCQKSPPEVTIKGCARCLQARYCSRACQAADWPSHRPNCVAQPRPSEIGNSNNSAFASLEQGTWLHGRPKQEVYGLLIDAYRLRIEDLHVFDNTADPYSAYSNNRDDLRGFRNFMRKVSDKSGALPPWWDADSSTAECERLAASDGWHNLSRRVEKIDVIERYRNNMMPMQLRLFSESVFGTYPGIAAGQSAAAIRAVVRGTHRTNIDISEILK